MTREQKIAEAVRLHDEEGLSDRQIGGRFGVTAGAVWKWRHPDKTREMNRAWNARHQAEKNEWTRQARKDPARMVPCPKCGGPTGALVWSGVSPAACERCIQAEKVARWELIEAWWAEGLTFSQIRARLGITKGHLSMEMTRMRVADRDLPYRRTPEQVERIREGARRWQAKRQAA